jgi:hypothetical protein
MPLYSAAEIKAKIDVLNTAIAKAETAQSYEAGAGMRLARGDLAAMYKERGRLEKLYATADAQESGAGVAMGVEFGSAE